jgi:uncharacterized protein (TIGR02996 family)
VDLDHVGDLDDLVPAARIDGVRVPQLARYLVRSEFEEGFPAPLMLLRPLVAIELPSADAIETAFLADIRAQPDDEAAWNAYSDWLQDQGRPPAGRWLLEQALTRAGVWVDAGFKQESDPHLYELGAQDLNEAHASALRVVKRLDSHPRPATSVVRVDDHIAQLCFRQGIWESVGRSIYEQWILFDDLWASAHPDLANGILRYVQRWDVLSSSRTQRR